MFTVKSCCGYSLKTGTLIILIFCLIFGVLKLILDVMLGLAAQYKFSAIIVIIVDVIITSFPVAAIYGVFKKRPTFLIPFLGLLMVLFVCFIIIMVMTVLAGTEVLNVILPFSIRKEPGAIEVIEMALGFLISGGMIYYFIAIVLSFYNELREQTRGKKIISRFLSELTRVREIWTRRSKCTSPNRAHIYESLTN